MADLSTWPPERLRALDRAVAKARGWTRIGNRLPDPDVLDYVWLGWRKSDGTASALEPVSTGCRDTFELMESLDGRRGIVPVDGRQWQIGPDVAPTIAIAICLAYLASEGRPFNE